jgi:hypothetical protein
MNVGNNTFLAVIESNFTLLLAGLNDRAMPIRIGFVEDDLRLIWIGGPNM